MTPELQTAMAHYETARAGYQQAVLVSLRGEANGPAIRRSIHAFRLASAELKHLQRAPVSLAAPSRGPAEGRVFPGSTFVRRLLRAA